ncbi:MAG TPA: translocation/assembly module TamB domain-containing protein, partial [Flavobacterium sp.]
MLGLIVLLLTIAILLSMPIVQTKLGKYVTERINKDYKTDIKVEQVVITVFGGVKLKNVLIKDHHKDTLIYANRIKTNILSFRKLYKGNLIFGDIRIDKMFFNLKQYKGEKNSNINIFIALFDPGKKTTKKKFLLKAKNAYLTNSHFLVTNENQQNPKNLELSKIDASLNNFQIYGPDITTKINKMSFKDHRGLVVENMYAQFAYTKKHLFLDNLDLTTENSEFKGKVALYYGNKGFSDFTNKVRLDINIDQSAIASNDIRFFYKDLGKNKIFNLKSKITGTLNNIVFKNLKLVDNNNTKIIGDISFKNLLAKGNQNFYMKGNFSRLTSNYDDLVAILPSKLSKKLPSALDKLGQFTLIGRTEITKTTINADFSMATSLGNVKSVLKMTAINAIDNARYSGNIILDNFNIGALLGRKDVGSVSLNFDIDGKGFSQKYLNTAAKGTISKLFYNKYNYTNIVVNGNFKFPVFEGEVNINDPNLVLDFNGLVDVSTKENHYEFHTRIDHANLKKLHLMKDSIAVFKGDIEMNVAGNNLDNLRGTIAIRQTSYQNTNDTYIFNDFVLESSFDENRVRTITINSPDIIEGKIVGKFSFNQLPKMFENAIGSLYGNYKPNKVRNGQFLSFNFSVYNKIVEIFYPGIKLGANTVLKGSVNSDNNEFSLNFSSPAINAFENYFDKIRIEIDNKNPLYNAYVQMDSIRTKYYKISDFSLLNVTANDTLFMRSEFKGGKKAQDYYNLNLYHTIDKSNNSVVGIQKSELKFKNFIWFLNEGELQDNRIVFDKKRKNFSIENITMTHGNQKIALAGKLRDSTYKDLELSFDNVNLNKITPHIDSLKVAGNLNGKINLKQNNAVYQPTSSIVIDSLNVNNIPLGILNLDITGNESFKQFTINSTLKNENVESFKVEGGFSIANKQTNLDLDVRFDKFNLAPFSAIGKNVISNIRGTISGASSITGTVKNPEVNGRLFLDNAGMRIPYLNIDYSFKESSIIDLSQDQFIFQNATLVDTKYNTEGRLNGTIKHKNFSKWDLDLAITSNRLLALNTKDTEDAAYYGVAFIDGKATIKGPTNNLSIEVDAKSKKGTEIKIPINNTESVGNKSFIRFLSPLEKYNLEKGIITKGKDYKGLELRFDLDLTTEAEIEIILDRETGHGMKAKGNGTLLLEINTAGKFNMFGDYQVYEGSYNFKYKGLIDKRFEVKKFSSISWEGDPRRARLNLEAIYYTAAYPSILMVNPSI